jgi:hypothetical protein
LWSAYNLYQNNFDLQRIDWAMLIGKTIVTWLLLGLLNILNFINGVRDGLQAFQGRIPEKMKWTERLAAKLSGLQNSLAIGNLQSPVASHETDQATRQTHV